MIAVEFPFLTKGITGPFPEPYSMVDVRGFLISSKLYKV